MLSAIPLLPKTEQADRMPDGEERRYPERRTDHRRTGHVRALPASATERAQHAAKASHEDGAQGERTARIKGARS